MKLLKEKAEQTAAMAVVTYSIVLVGEYFLKFAACNPFRFSVTLSLRVGAHRQSELRVGSV